MKKILIFVAHPDDEIIGCGERILNALQNKNIIKIVFFTKNNQINSAKIIMKRLGIPAVYLNYPDSGLVKENPKKLMQIVKKHIRTFQPDQINVPAFEGGHIDHDIVNFIVNKANKDRTPLYEFGMYNRNMYSIKKIFLILLSKFNHREYPIFVNNLTKNISDNKKLIKEKNRLITVYSSKLLKRSHDIIRRIPSHNYLKRPHRGKLSYEAEGICTFKEFQRFVKCLR